VRRSLLPDGTPKAPKTDAGTRTVPLLPALRRLLVAWKLRAPHTDAADLAIATAEAKPVAERNVRRALEDAKNAAGLDDMDGRLSMHSLRHGFASMLATDLDLPATTLARLTGHADAGFTLRIYARDGRDTTAIVEDVLVRAAEAKVGAEPWSGVGSGFGVSWCRLVTLRRSEAPRNGAACRSQSLRVVSCAFLAMQKVVGSSPIIRSKETRWKRLVFLSPPRLVDWGRRETMAPDDQPSPEVPMLRANEEPFRPHSFVNSACQG
jgi:Phage integrase family